MSRKRNHTPTLVEVEPTVPGRTRVIRHYPLKGYRVTREIRQETSLTGDGTSAYISTQIP